jgi:hypothetical protein
MLNFVRLIHTHTHTHTHVIKSFIRLWNYTHILIIEHNLKITHTRQDTSGRGIGPWQRPMYLYSTQCSQETNAHAPGRIRTRNLSKRAVADLHLRPCGHRDKLAWILRSRFVCYKDGNKRYELLKVALFDKYICTSVYPFPPPLPLERQFCAVEGFFVSIGAADMWTFVNCVVV